MNAMNSLDVLTHKPHHTIGRNLGLNADGLVCWELQSNVCSFI